MNPVFKRVATGLTVGAAVIAAILLAPPKAIMTVMAALCALAFLEFGVLLSRKVSPRRKAIRFFVSLLAGCAVIGCGLWALPTIALRHGNVMLLYIVAIVKFSDVGGFAVGLTTAKLMKGGNHKMCPAISPGKSWEGLVGSFVFSCIVSCAFIPATHFAVAKALTFGASAAVLGTAGDLVESKFKRWVGVKDSSALKITNGLGGILDMLDSLIFAPAILMAAI